MPRRLLTALLAVLVVTTLASCGVTGSHDTVATLNGVELSRDEFNSWIDSPLGRNLLAITGPSTGTAGGAAARSLITVWAVTNLVREVAGDSLDRATAEKSMSESNATTWATAPAGLKRVAIDFSAASALAQSGTLDQQALAEAAARARVTIDPRIGVWDPGNIKVVSAG